MPVEVPKMNRFVSMTPEREAKIDQLLQKVKENYDPLPFVLRYAMSTPRSEENPPTVRDPVRLFAYMFLVSRRWDVENAYTMLQQVTAFREEANLNSLRQLPSAFSLRGWDEKKVCEFFNAEPRVRPDRFDKVTSGIDAHLQCGLHYWDKSGLPVLYMMIGNTDEEGLLKKLKQLATIGQKPVDVMWEYVQHAIAVGEEVALYQQHLWETGELAKCGVDASEGNIRAVTLVVDCTGLNYKMLWKPAVNLFMDVVKKIFSYWPDCVHRILAVNTPGMVMFAYNIVKGALDEGVQRKVSFYNAKDTPEALSQVIDVKYIPKFLGGQCECEGHCIAPFDPANPKRQSKEEDAADVVTEDIVLKAGKKHEKVFHLQRDETVFWDFTTQAGKDVSFGLYFIPASHKQSKDDKFSSKELEPFLVNKNRPTSGTDSYHAPEDGTVVLVWDNKYSWFSSKTVQMRVYMQAEDGTQSN